MTPFPRLSGAAGAAFKLAHPSEKDISFEHPDGTVTIRAHAPYLTVEFTGTPPVLDILRHASSIVQETLDVLASTQQALLSTRVALRGSMYWVKAAGAYTLTIIDVGDQTWSVSGSISVGGGVALAQPAPFAHHQSMRFYRLAQLADNLFDAFRNTYLALECLVSDLSPRIESGKNSESELNWLKRVLLDPNCTRVPGGITSLDIDAIYAQGRTNLFHAKSNKTFFEPYGNDRDTIQNLLDRMTIIVITLLQLKCGSTSARRHGSMTQAIEDSQISVIAQFDNLSIVGSNGETSGPVTPVLCTNPRRFGLPWISVGMDIPSHQRTGTASEIRWRQQATSWMTLELDEGIPLDEVQRVCWEINFTMRNVHAPKSTHDR